jgi:hypothetical protein
VFVTSLFLQDSLIFAGKAGACSTLTNIRKDLAGTNTLAYFASQVSDEEKKFYNVNDRTTATSSVTLVTSNNDGCDADAGFKILSKRDEEAERRVGSGVDHPSVKVGRSSLVKYKANNRNKVSLKHFVLFVTYEWAQ